MARIDRRPRSSARADRSARHELAAGNGSEGRQRTAHAGGERRGGTVGTGGERCRQPAPVPSPARPVIMRKPVGFQEWRDLLFLHWEMSPGVIRPLVPRRLELDLFDGRAYVTLIPFAIPESLPVRAPRVLSSDLLEVNLRTYVLGPDGEPGIYFWSL